MGGPFSQQVSQEAMELLQRAEGQGEGACAVTVLLPPGPSPPEWALESL